MISQCWHLPEQFNSASQWSSIFGSNANQPAKLFCSNALSFKGRVSQISEQRPPKPDLLLVPTSPPRFCAMHWFSIHLSKNTQVEWRALYSTGQEHCFSLPKTTSLPNVWALVNKDCCATAKVGFAHPRTNSQVLTLAEKAMLCLSLKCQHFFISLFINSHQNPKCCNSWPQMRQNRWNGAKQVISQGSVLPRLQITTFLGLAILRPKWQISSTANTENKSSFNFSYISSWLKNLPRFREIPFLSTKERQYNDGHFT